VARILHLKYKIFLTGGVMNAIVKENVFAVLKNNISIRLCRFAEGIGNWRQSRDKKPAIIMAARSGSIRRVK